MKKKFLAVLILLSIIFTSEVNAGTTYDGVIYEGEKINMYYYKHRDDTAEVQYEYHNFHSQASVFKRSTDNATVYCIESWAPLPAGSTADYFESTDGSETKLSASQIEKVKKLIYYGYGYKDATHDHTALLWYPVTQVLIWRVTNPEIQHYFASSLTSSTPISTYDAELAELESMVNSKTGQINKNLGSTFIGDIVEFDFPDNLGNYNSTNSSNIQVGKNTTTNKVAINPMVSGSANITFKEKTNRFTESTKFYVSANFQDAISVGNIDGQTIKYDLEIKAGTIVHKAYEVKPNNSLTPVKDHVFCLYAKEPIFVNGSLRYPKDALIKKGTTRNGIVSFDGLPRGKYYVTEETPFDEYYDSPQTLDYEVVDEKTVEHTAYYHRQKLKINIKKLVTIPIVRNEKIYYVQATKEGIEFSIFNEDDDIVATASTNDFGFINFDLNIPYGKYYIKETKSLDNYSSDFKYEFEFNIIGKTEYQVLETIDVINYPKYKDLKIKKVDEDNNPLEGVEFEVYTSNLEKVGTLITNANGESSLNLPEGKYYLKETKTNEDLELIEGYIEINLDDEADIYTITNKVKTIPEEEIKEEVEKNKDELKEEIISGSTVRLPETVYEPVEVSIGKTGLNDYIKFMLIIAISLSLLLVKLCIKKS